MGSEKSIGKYRLGRTIGEGTFSKVKVAFNGDNGDKVAIKVIDKQMVMKSKLKYQVSSISFCLLFSLLQVEISKVIIYFY